MTATLLRRYMMLTETLMVLREALARAEVLTDRQGTKVVVNPSQAMMRRMPIETRVCAIGDDIAVADAAKMTHIDIIQVLRDMAHPMYQARATLAMHYYTALRPSKLYWVARVKDEDGDLVPYARWNAGLRHALGDPNVVPARMVEAGEINQGDDRMDEDIKSQQGQSPATEPRIDPDNPPLTGKEVWRSGKERILQRIADQKAKAAARKAKSKSP